MGFEAGEAERNLKVDETTPARRAAQLGGIVPAWRELAAREIEWLEHAGNRCADWSRVRVHPEEFNARLIQDCSFAGLVRIGRLATGGAQGPLAQGTGFTLPVGLRRAHFVDCILGDHVTIEDAGRLERVVVGNGAVLWRVGRIVTQAPARFGCGGDCGAHGEPVRAPLELQNENGRRQVFAWPGITVGLAAFWTQMIGNTAVTHRLTALADAWAAEHAADCSEIGAGALVLDCRTLLNVKIGAAARLEGAEWLEEITVQSAPGAPTRLGSGVELVRGIVGYGNHLHGGARARDFVTGENVELDLGVRVTQAFIGDASQIARGEVSNALLFPHHHQHHNNSFVIAARIEGQCNVAAGVTLGSNHNSRAADGEIIAGRGFWPGLCTNFKHPSRFAPFVLVAKGNYPNELKIEFPFALVSNSDGDRELRIAPAWLWLHNAYALLRNEAKFVARDARHFKTQAIETRALAPDTVEAMLHAMQLIHDALRQAGRTGTEPDDAPIPVSGAEKSRRMVWLLRPATALAKYRELCRYYVAGEIMSDLAAPETFAARFQLLQQILTDRTLGRETQWHNLGGLLVEHRELQAWCEVIAGAKDRDALQVQLNAWSTLAPAKRLAHACAVLLHLEPAFATTFGTHARTLWGNLLHGAATTARGLATGAQTARARDFSEPFRHITCAGEEEFVAAFGRLEDDPCLAQLARQAEAFAALAHEIVARMAKTL
jgi:hypothetical protein